VTGVEKPGGRSRVQLALLVFFLTLAATTGALLLAPVVLR